MSLEISYPWWYIVCSLVAGAVVALWLYRGDRHFRSLGRRFLPVWWVMGILRWLTLSGLLFLLADPLVRVLTSRLEKPILVFLQDESQSIAFSLGKDSSSYVAAVRKLLDQWQEAYDVKAFGFGDRVTSAPTFRFERPATDIANALQHVQDRFSGRNVQAIVLASDGIFNQGSSPLQVVEGIAAPVYTIALGDTAVQRDVSVEMVRFNSPVFVGDRYPVRVEINARSCSGERTTVSMVEVLPGETIPVASHSVTLGRSDVLVRVDFVLQAQRPGISHYRIRVAPVANELTDANNVQDIYVEVVERRQRILLLAAAPHPDLAALRQAIVRSGSYEVDLVIGASEPIAWSEYDLIAFHQLPVPGEPIAPLVASMRQAKKPMLFFLGASTSVSLWNVSQNVLKIAAVTSGVSEALPVLNDNFNFLSVPEVVKARTGSFPPLTVPFGEYRTEGNVQVLMYQKVGAVATHYPLWLFQEDMLGRSVVVCGEGFWRWRFWEYRTFRSHEATEALVSMSLQYLFAQAVDQPFRVWLTRGGSSGANVLLSETEVVAFGAELFNEARQLVNHPDVKLVLKNEQGEEFEHVFERVGDTYSLQLGTLPTGNYNWVATTQWAGKKFQREGRFAVTPMHMEVTELRADHRLLYNVSSKTNGRFFTAAQLSELKDFLVEQKPPKSMLFGSTRTHPLIHVVWLLAVFIFLLTMEWFLRRWHGTY